MKRRTFVKLATVGTAAMYLPNLDCRPRHNSFAKLLAQPGELQHICDATTIKEIGEAYQKQAITENNEAALEKILAVDMNNRPMNESSNEAYATAQLAKRVKNDFAQNNTVIVNGWILSVTEARQCALFSMTEN